MIAGNEKQTLTDFNPQPAWAEAWHLWTVFFPRRSVTDRLRRRHNGRHWTYKKFIEFTTERDH
jgi:hypothetical protein